MWPRLLLFGVDSASALGNGSRSGAVQDAAGRPVEHATVLIYHAGVKHGYSIMCPSCYIDCGKRDYRRGW